MTTINEGGYFGELALVTHKARAATVTANAEEIRVACKYLCHLLNIANHLFFCRGKMICPQTEILPLLLNIPQFSFGCKCIWAVAGSMHGCYEGSGGRLWGPTNKDIWIESQYLRYTIDWISSNYERCYITMFMLQLEKSIPVSLKKLWFWIPPQKKLIILSTKCSNI